MLTYEELRRINTERKKDYEAFRANHEKRMAKLEERKKRLQSECTWLENIVYGATVKMDIK